MSDHWYETVDAASRVTQGDLVFDCPLLGWKSDEIAVSQSEGAETLRGFSNAVKADVVVMTQACDLDQEHVDNVVVCPHTALSTYKQDWEQEMRDREQTPSERAWNRHYNDAKNGFVWNLTLLNSASLPSHSLEQRVVDFHELFTIPRVFLESLVAGRGSTRIRLLPPYREHLSQAFARYFMRVGLPVPVAQPT